MHLKQAVLAAALALAPLTAVEPASAVVVGVHIGPGHSGHYCGWHHACWRYRWHGGYYNYFSHGRYWRSRYHCHHGWCYR